jgi:hypothetical protein
MSNHFVQASLCDALYLFLRIPALKGRAKIRPPLRGFNKGSQQNLKKIGGGGLYTIA